MFILLLNLKNKPEIRLESVIVIRVCGVKFRTGCRLVRIAAFVTQVHIMVGAYFATIMH